MDTNNRVKWVYNASLVLIGFIAGLIIGAIFGFLMYHFVLGSMIGVC